MRWEWSYEKDETHTELFGVDDQWIKKIYFDRQSLSAQELEQYPDPKKPPPWIDSGAGKPTKVAADIVGPEVCKNGGWMLADDDGGAADEPKKASLRTAVNSIIAIDRLASGGSHIKMDAIRLDQLPHERSLNDCCVGYLATHLICLHACMHVCMYVFMYVCLYVCMYVCLYVCSMYVCMYACM